MRTLLHDIQPLEGAHWLDKAVQALESLEHQNVMLLLDANAVVAHDVDRIGRVPGVDIDSTKYFIVSELPITISRLRTSLRPSIFAGGDP